MELVKLRGRTYCLPGPTNVVVYLCRNGSCVLVDTGLDSASGKRILEEVEARGSKVRVIVHTHAHPDHFAADNAIRSAHTAAAVWASAGERLFMENPELESMYLYGGNPPRDLMTKFVRGPRTEVDRILPASGEVELGDALFRVVELPGHSPSHVGLVTPDDVLAAGDALFGADTRAKYPFPFLFNVGAELATLDHLADYTSLSWVLGHGSFPQNPRADIEANRRQLYQHLENFRDWLAQPLTREDLGEKVVQTFQLSVDLVQLHLILTTVSAMLTYLYEQGLVDRTVVDGKAYYFAT